MKKFLTALTCTVLAVLTVAGFTACGDTPDPDKVNLVAVDAATVVPNDEIDYFVVPEPAASAKIKATSSNPNGFKMVGDLQELYGGSNGYPQAVIVAKNGLLENGALSKFTEAVSENAEWLLNPETEIQTIVNAVTSHLPQDTTPTFSSANLTKGVISNCGIRYSSPMQSKEEIKSFLTALKGVQSNINDNLADEFFWDGKTSSQTAFSSISVYAPDGAPALALAGLMAGEIDTSEVAQTINYHIVDASTIQIHVTGASPDADICILPVNLAANILGTAEKYTLIGTVTHGNLYIISAKTGERITAENLESLRGKTVGVVNLAAIPGLTFKLILNKYGIEYTNLQ